MNQQEMNAQNAANMQQYQHQEQTKEQTKTQERPEGGKNHQFQFNFANDKLDEELRKPRSRAYMECFAAIDMLSATDEEIIAQLKASVDEETAEEFSQMSTEELLEEIKASFKEEFEKLEVRSVLIGVLAQCYVAGCDVHAISPEGHIINHFNKELELPDGLQKGRIVYNKYPNCRCVEVYTDCCRVVQNDSTVIKISNTEI